MKQFKGFVQLLAGSKMKKASEANLDFRRIADKVFFQGKGLLREMSLEEVNVQGKNGN